MAVTSGRTTSVAFSSGLVATIAEAAASNTNSPGSITVHTLASGANTITLPTGGTVPAAATIVPPSGNTETITLKGVTGDTGIVLHKTDPCTVSLGTTAAGTFCLTAGGTITGLRIIWS